MDPDLAHVIAVARDRFAAKSHADGRFLTQLVRGAAVSPAVIARQEQ
jgi:hypothetical protein